MAAAFEDDDLSLSISNSQAARRNSNDARHPPRGNDMPPTAPSIPKPSQAQHVQNTMKRRLGQYIMERTLGEGSFGKVKLATHKSSGQKVALKIISRQKLITRDMAGRIEREIQYLQLLRHPHIIKLYTVITTPKEIIMVLEYAGGELFDYIVNHGKMHEEKARKFFQQIVCAVEYCHRHKIVHRDLKPENLLLDDSLNVKIADFGLSNIMTDGNFLKTSCGSPNYAAPEVISGKLYAGPEVDVWSCGVILYVLLTGRLPFDDEYIPALFRKIAQGNYTMPNYISSGAARLIRRMLQVNPVNRITVQEIRQDPWFVKDLAEYLQPPVEEFLDTGVDPNKAIDPRRLAPDKPAVIQEKLHESVVGKLGKTMGYARDDVQEALAKDEPSAIKDAYLIVRENAIMKTNPALAQNESLQPFLAQSPPAFATTTHPASLPPATRPPPSPVGTSNASERPRHGSTSSQSIMDARSPVSTIGVLPSSLPSYHQAFMSGHMPSHNTAPQQEDLAPPDPQRHQSTEERAETARRLKPHSRNSHAHSRNIEKPEVMTPLPSKDGVKKPKPTKWQFGIRSRNSPTEAILAIYKALKSMGAVWEVPKIRRPGGGESNEGSPDREERQRRERDRQGSQSPEYSDSDPDAGTDPEYATQEERARRNARRGSSAISASSSDGEGPDPSRHRKRRPRGRDRFGPWNDWGYKLPEDPWIINARFRKDGMFPPGVAHPSSTHSSRVDLHDAASIHRRRSSTMGSSTSLPTSHNDTPPGVSSASQSTENVAVTGPASAETGRSSSLSRRFMPAPDESCWVYVTIQLYCIEADSFMVDFKCAGYERLVRRFRRELGRGSQSGENGVEVDSAGEESDDGDDMDEGYVGLGRVTEEKDISSPFPFMDVASALIVNLANGD
ncbi:Protein kinase [Zalaria obscura]|uniref:Protein kinase n=1 Tax=Zalaria obscura TaxID=2024903 RepID=A0ACC3SCC8_9PEZI